MPELDERPIGVFDSGVGGLTVLDALRRELPNEQLLYLGDTARLPYGTKSPRSIERYALKAASALRERGIKLLVVACNTASAVALGALRDALPDLPVVGVVEPGADAATAVRRGGHHLVLATEATVRLSAYRKAIAVRDPDARVTEQACEMLVALAEEGWTQGSIARDIAARYIEPVFDTAGRPDSIILGCTHFPLLKRTIADVAGSGIAVVDSAATTALAVATQLGGLGLAAQAAAGNISLMATDGATRFARVGGSFLGERLSPEDVEIIDI